MAFYLFNFASTQASGSLSLREQATRLLRAGAWQVGADEPHRDALAPGDYALIYAAAPDSVFVGRAVVASPVQDLASSTTHADGPDVRTGVPLSDIVEWNPPVPIESVLARIGPSEKVK